jgi:hypothetical protein
MSRCARVLSILAVVSASCGESESPQASSQTSNLVASEVGAVASQAGLQAGGKIGKGDLTLSNGALAGALAGAAGTVNVSGSVTPSGSGWALDATLTFDGYKGASGLLLSGTLHASYALTVDVSVPESPKVSFTATVKGELSVNGSELAKVELTLTVNAQGGTSCSGSVNGFAVGAACGAAPVPKHDAGTLPPIPGLDGGPLPPAPDQGTPAPTPDASTPPGPAPACDAALEKSACGGTLAGSYLYKEACASAEIVAPLSAFCAGATASNVKAVNKGGTLSFTGASYALASNTEVAYDLAIPASCGVLSCQAAGAAASSALGAKGASNVTVTCSGGLSGCTCKVGYTIVLSKSGAFTSAGGVATLATGEQYWYCVKGGGLLYKGKANTLDVGIAYALSR